MPTVVATFKDREDRRAVLDEVFSGVAEVVFLGSLPDEERQECLKRADALISSNTATQLNAGEVALLGNTKFVQFLSAGVDFIPLADLPDHITIACNGGAYAEPMAEHGLAMVLAAYKRLFEEHEKLKSGEFDQFKRNRMLRGAVCGILGFGGIGVAMAQVMRGLGAQVHAVNRRGATDVPVDWIGTTDDVATLFSSSDILVLSLPLTPATKHSIGARELNQMKDDAVLVNLARGEIIEEQALYEHLQANPAFTACIDAWWEEPIRHGSFSTNCDFFSLPNVIGSPHNSASVGVWRAVALRRAAENARRFLRGEAPLHVVPPEDRLH